MLDGRAADAESGAAILEAGPRPATTTEERKPIVIVLHQLHSNPGHIGQWFHKTRLPS